MRAIEFISEAFDNPYKSRKGRTRTPEQAAQYIFWIKNSLKRYRVTFHKANDNSNAIALEFGRDSIFGTLNFGRTNDLSTEQAIRVFSTIADILKKFLSEFPEVNEIYFQGYRKDNETIETAKRIKLYKILAAKMSKELGFPRIEQEVIPDPKPGQPPIGIGFKLLKGNTWSSAGPISSSIPKTKTESLDKPYPWRQARAKYSMAKYVFRANNILKRYNISFDLISDNRVEVGFGRYTLTRGLEQGKTKDSFQEAQKIFATVGAVIMDFLKNNPSVNTIHFSAPADEGETEKTSSRIKLYGALAKRLQKQLGWPNITRKVDMQILRDAPIVYWDISKNDDKLEPSQDRDYAAAQAAKNRNPPILNKIYPTRKALAVDQVLRKI